MREAGGVADGGFLRGEFLLLRAAAFPAYLLLLRARLPVFLRDLPALARPHIRLLDSKDRFKFRQPCPRRIHQRPQPHLRVCKAISSGATGYGQVIAVGHFGLAAFRLQTTMAGAVPKTHTHSFRQSAPCQIKSLS